ncbi:STAS domain-containing protein [Mycolicibacterium sp. CBM1]
MIEAQFRLSTASDHDAPRVIAAGDIDLANVSQFQDAMSKAMADATAVTVDLGEVTYCDSATIRALFAVAATVDLTMIVAADGPIRALLGISGLDRVATVVIEE